MALRAPQSCPSHFFGQRRIALQDRQFANASQLDPSVALMPDMKKATRDVLHAVVPAGWLRTEKVVDEMLAEKAAQEQQAKLMALMEQGAGIAKTTSEAAGNVAAALPQFGLA